MDQLIKLGFHRILTSGFASHVDIGLPNLKEMKGYANGRIEIMAGGGVNAGNIAKIAKGITFFAKDSLFIAQLFYF
jgi:copper homeostasis protein